VKQDGARDDCGTMVSTRMHVSDVAFELKQQSTSNKWWIPVLSTMGVTIHNYFTYCRHDEAPYTSATFEATLSGTSRVSSLLMSALLSSLSIASFLLAHICLTSVELTCLY